MLSDLKNQFAYGRGGRWLIAIVAAAIISFGAKVIIARNTYGSLDAVLWGIDLANLHHDGAIALYRNGTTVLIPGLADHHHEVFNHPPFMLRMLSWWGWLSDVSGRPLRFWLRFTCSALDLMSIALLAGMMLRTESEFRPASLLLVAVSPVSLMISGFHCNVDPIMVGFLLLSIYLLETGPVWPAGMAFGMAINIKVVPLIFLPAIFLYLSGKKRIHFFLATAGAVVIASLPIIVQDPLLVMRQVFGYNPLSGNWGISRFVFALASDASFSIYARFAKIPLMLVVILVSLWMNARERKPILGLQLGFISFLFLALSPGFGVQYLAWLVPWTYFLTLRQSLAFHLTGGLLLFSYYSRAAGQFPWDLAYSGKQEFYGLLVLIGLLCWFCVCWLALCFARKLNSGNPWAQNTARSFTGSREVLTRRYEEVL
jgi:Glycosyltransferase family 87